MAKNIRLYTVKKDVDRTKTQINNNYYFNYLKNKKLSDLESKLPTLSEDEFFNTH